MNRKKRAKPYVKYKKSVNSTKSTRRAQTVRPRPTRTTSRRKYTRRRMNRSRPHSTDYSTGLLKTLSSINLGTIIQSIDSIRSTVKDLRTSLEKLDRVMDSAFQMFQMIQSRQAPLRLPSTNENTEWEYSDDPFDDEQDNRRRDDNLPLAGLLEQVDIGQLISMLQSPIFQGLIKQFFKQK